MALVEADWAGLLDSIDRFDLDGGRDHRLVAHIDGVLRAAPDWRRMGRPAGGRARAAMDVYDSDLERIDGYSREANRAASMLKEKGLYAYAEGIDRVVRRLMDAYARILVRKGGIYNSAAEYAKSRECLERALCIRAVPEAYGLLWAALAGLGEYEKAEVCLAAAGMDGRLYVEAQYNAALLHDMMGLHRRASLEFDRVLELARERAPGGRARIPDRHDILLHKGEALLHDGQYAGAVECFDGAISAEPASPGAAHRKARALYLAGDYDGAASWYERAASAGDGAAAAMRDKILSLRDGVRGRMRLPLAASAQEGGFRGMPQLQYAVYIIQQESGADGYDFGSEWGPYSDDLAHDISANTELMTVTADRYGAPAPSRTCSITERGRDLLRGPLMRGAGGITGMAAACGRMAPADMLDRAYATFSARPAEGSVRRRLARASRLDGPRPVSEAALVASHAESALGETGGARSDRGAVLNLAGIIAHLCERIERHCARPSDLHAAGMEALDIRAYGGLLLEYRRARGAEGRAPVPSAAGR
ncbi:MAG: tetratricopeptide repeat protein [Nitrosopumilus sp.]|nr:tetratricopeptide repeat protein [Nitrosopumilus sp.]MDA7944254.1 tetratricopeptide repeat protein [Nitrosopumilus sp.]MDA7954006.1 tetratricopeptide repeat protein [Nitrosopumilus sp.]MDA7959652.1 tetratricopeptide repeat protein [Nitrosopumilus sp.]MDA7972934.1 tetratricopeptide repeat protein [Nitrosopumilus sp.]